MTKMLLNQLSAYLKKETILFTADDLSCYMVLIPKTMSRKTNLIRFTALFIPSNAALFTNKQKTNNTLLIYALLKYLIEILKGLAAAIRVYYLNTLCLKPRQSKRHGYAMIVIRFNFTRLNTLCRINP